MAHDWRAPQAAPIAQAPSLALPRQAAVAHAVFTPDVRRPVEVGADHESQLITWLTKRMGTPIAAPHLQAQGLDLVGGRLLPGQQGPVAQLMYQDAAGQRLTLYISREIDGNTSTAFQYAQEGKLSVFYWVDGPMGYALSAPWPKDRLATIASAVYEQLDAPSR
jgi:anti-sigma factor RsiW